MKSFVNFFSRLFDNNSSSPSKANKHRNHRISRIEALEDRDMLSVNLLQVPQYSSLPEAEYAIFLDFNGNQMGTTLNGSDGNPIHAFSVDSDNDSFNAQELQMITDLWAYTAEMYRPFNISVTTVESEAYGKKGSHVCFGGTGVGTAWIDVAGRGIGDDIDAMIGMPKGYGIYDVQASGQTITHETGHNFGLYHDGSNDDGEYYWGHDIDDSATNTSGYWNTVMGGCLTNYSVQIFQFSKGEYEDAISAIPGEDDLQVISNQTGYRPDTDLEFIENGNEQVATGIIERSGDADSTTFTIYEKGTYSFEAVSGITLAGQQVSSLYYVLTLTNETTGNVVFEKYSPLDTFNVSFEGELAAGTYTLSIAGAGIDATGTMKGFTEYGSLGSYSITTSVFEDPAPLPEGPAVTSTPSPDGKQVSVTWENLGSDYNYTVFKAGRIVVSYGSATSFEDLNIPAAGIESYAVIAYNTVSHKFTAPVTTVAWTTARKLEASHEELPEGKIELKWTPMDGMNYTVFRAGRIVSDGKITDAWTDNSPLTTNEYMLVAFYKDGTTWRTTYSNIHKVTKPQTFTSSAKSLDDFWSRYGQTQEDLLDTTKFASLQESLGSQRLG